MYSKERGYSRPMSQMPGQMPGQRAAYQPAYQPAYRQPPRQRMQVPPNYSGNAIVDGEERPLGRPPGQPLGQVDEAVSEAAVGAEGPVPTFEHLPRVSELGAPARGGTVPQIAGVGGPPVGPPVGPPAEEHEVNPGEDSADKPGGPPRPDAARSPFGRGLGLEELLLAGMILFFLREGADCPERGDLDETVILLGLLLLLG